MGVLPLEGELVQLDVKKLGRIPDGGERVITDNAFAYRNSAAPHQAVAELVPGISWS